MKRMGSLLLALVLVLALTLSGCNMAGIGQTLDRFYTMLQLGMATPFEDMEYFRPDMADFREKLEQTLALAETESNVDILMESVYALYTFYYDFTTAYALANIHYCRNMTDIYWEAEYSWCMEYSSEVSAGMDRLLYALADCPLRGALEADDFFGDGFFDMYEGESLWDETFTALMEAETALVDRYYELNTQALEVPYYSEEYFSGVGYEIEQVFLELVKVRRQIAEYAGYESFPEFAYEFYHYRDYSPEEAEAYVQQIRTELVPLYLQLEGDAWAPAYESCSQEEMLAYVEGCAEALGGVAGEAFALMEKANLYDITYSENKYAASFEVFLMNYYSPYVFVCPQGNGQDLLTFTHEFGHFCNDYAVGGSVGGVDVAEVFSQGLEYLSLCYCEDTEALTKMKMADSLCIFVEQAAYASFEHQVYTLPEEALTVETIRGLYQTVGEAFGFAAMDRDSRDYTLIPHFFISPMYVISYVVSNDAAMQIYQAELQTQGAGVRMWEDGLFSMQIGYLAFIEEQGLESPFTEGRVAQLRKTLEEKLR